MKVTLNKEQIERFIFAPLRKSIINFRRSKYQHGEGSFITEAYGDQLIYLSEFISYFNLRDDYNQWIEQTYIKLCPGDCDQCKYAYQETDHGYFYEESKIHCRLKEDPTI